MGSLIDDFVGDSDCPYATGSSWLVTLKVAVTDDQKLHIEEVRTLVLDTASYLDSVEIFPRQNTKADIVLLALISKAFSLFWAVTRLDEDSFPDEAFGLARTSVELRLIVRYLTNVDTHARCLRYFNFGAKVATRNNELLAAHAPDKVRGETGPGLEELASRYSTHHSWANEGKTKVGIKDFASEPSPNEIDNSGQPSTQKITYDTLYWSMSSFVHVDVRALLRSHMPEFGRAFSINREAGQKARGTIASDTAARSLGLAIGRSLDFFGIMIPDELAHRFRRVLL